MIRLANMNFVVMHHKVIQLINLATFVVSAIDTTPSPDAEADLMKMMAQLLLVE